MFFPSSLVKGQRDKISRIITRLEEAGFNVLPGFGRDREVLKEIMLDGAGRARVDILVSFSMKFSSAINDELKHLVLQLDVPIINAITLYSSPVDRWRRDPNGIPPIDITWTIATPEVSGLVEPTPLGGKIRKVDPVKGKIFYEYKVIEGNLETLVRRLKGWMRLKGKRNSEKRIAILYYNHHQGKQNVGASYLNVFASLENILNRLKKEGYRVEGEIAEKEIKGLVIAAGRNIGSWAPGELEKMLVAGEAVQLPMDIYEKWFSALPGEFKKGVIKQWGTPRDSSIMTREGKIIIPVIRLGNVVIMPEPARGWSDDPMKLYHDTTLYPHHQYVAAYLWLKYGFNADAMIHLGTHATHEWLPGKQTGLSRACPPEVLITDIPNIYPYIVDDIGEGVQAKRRGRAVIIDHLTPLVIHSKLYGEYARIYGLINDYRRAKARKSRTADLKLKEIESLVAKTGILKDLGLQSKPGKGVHLTDEILESLEHYLMEIRESYVLYGLHVFGSSPAGDALEETVARISELNHQVDEKEVEKRLDLSGRLELDRLIRALSVRFVPPGEGNDPMRNPDAVPTGKNFYGFDPSKVPSRAAWQLGKKAADEIILNHVKRHNKIPEKVAVVLWATETIRNEGVNECTILALMGLKPRWDRTGRVTGVDVIPGKALGRSRIDVLINPSGLYRDLFPDRLLWLDEAVQKAAAQKDVENLIAIHNHEIKKRLIYAGIDRKEAETLSRLRIFTAKPGSYGNGVAEMTGASGVWRSDSEVVKVYEMRAGFVFGQGKWGESAQQLLRENLSGVDVAVHSSSSNIYGTMDNDDFFQYLGGLSLAVTKESGKAPDTMITLQQVSGDVRVEDAAKTIGRELRSRYLNPRWIEGMKKQDYAGAREISNFVENMWGWQVTLPDSIDADKWQQTYEVYVEDKYQLDIKEFFNKANPWAYQSVTARMLEAVRKGYWQPTEDVKKRLAAEYAVDVVEKGVACCDHTCNNPLLNQMVMNIISVPGVLSPEIAEKFKLAIEQTAKSKLSDQVKKRVELQKSLGKVLTREDMKTAHADGENKKVESSRDAKPAEAVKGYRMEDMKRDDDASRMSSSGFQWIAIVVVLFFLALGLIGAIRHLRSS